MGSAANVQEHTQPTRRQCLEQAQRRYIKARRNARERSKISFFDLAGMARFVENDPEYQAAKAQLAALQAQPA